MELRDIVSIWLSEGRYLQLATSAGDQPWICTVGFVSDDDFNIYWFSRNSRRHSQDILKNTHVAATIVHDTKTRQAIQLTGTAVQVPHADAANIHAQYKAKLGFEPVSLEDLATSTEVSFWKLTPVTLETWDEANYPASPKQVYLPKR